MYIYIKWPLPIGYVIDDVIKGTTIVLCACHMTGHFIWYDQVLVYGILYDSCCPVLYNHPVPLHCTTSLTVRTVLLCSWVMSFHIFGFHFLAFVGLVRCYCGAPWLVEKLFYAQNGVNPYFRFPCIHIFGFRVNPFSVSVYCTVHTTSLTVRTVLPCSWVMSFHIFGFRFLAFVRLVRCYCGAPWLVEKLFYAQNGVNPYFRFTCIHIFGFRANIYFWFPFFGGRWVSTLLLWCTITRRKFVL